ncbi:MAG: tRNA lysidine(34) synthetase TilS [Myxococcota bacterium]
MADHEPVVVAVSGGRDSMALWHLSVDRLGARVHAAHVDHRVRPDSERDARLVARVAEQGALPYSVSRLEPGARDEARLRKERLAALERVRLRIGARWVLLAHHRDDQAETVMLEILRRGRPLGMPQIRPPFVRPWLSIPGAAVAAYAQRQKVPWNEDSTNRDPRYLRNRVRRELLPLLERGYRGGIRRRLAALASLDLPRQGPPRPLPSPTPSPPPPSFWPEGSRLSFDKLSYVPNLHRCDELGPHRAIFDADHIMCPSVGEVRPGDRIQPLGMVGSRKIADLLREAGVVQAARTRYPVVRDQQRILWVPGVARSAVAPVCASTRNVWVFGWI